MSLEILKRVAKKFDSDNSVPHWVSEKNISLNAYNCINLLKSEKTSYISTHNKISDFKKKGLYQISASEVARKIGAATPTLISTSAYSPNLKRYLDETNSELDVLRAKKIATREKSLSAGTKQRKKEDITMELQSTRAELLALQKQNALDQVNLALKALSLPIKHKLGIDI